MQLHIQRDFECQAAAATVRGAWEAAGFWPLADGGPRSWLGSAWRIDQAHDSAALRWAARAEDGPALSCYATIHLLPAGSSTHARLHATFELPGTHPLNPLARWRAQRRLAAGLDQAIARLRAGWQAAGGAETHPLTKAAFAAMGAEAELERIKGLDERWARFEAGAWPPAAADAPHAVTEQLPEAAEQYDLAYAGGGLGLLHAALMARLGYKVLVFDRYEVGCAHREWNISAAELGRLVATGLASWEELEREVIMARYDDGVVRFHPGGSNVPPAELRMAGVLDLALDAGALLRLARRRLIEAGGAIREGVAFEEVMVHPDQRRGVVVRLTRDGADEFVGARLLIDAMGATSPLALAAHPFSGICPTVGTVLHGARDHDPKLGDILISVADAQGGRQLIWEGFPGRGDELTVYVFYYDKVGPAAQHRHSLLDLFEDYFRLLPDYKAPGADFRHERPVFGFIPARHAVKRPVPLRGVLPLGDAAAQQSPLTFCGFGSFVRNLGRTTRLLDTALRYDLLEPELLALISARQANVGLNWVFSRFMAPWDRPQDVNELQNVFARVLNDLGPGVSKRFFQDQMTWRDYRAIILGTLRRYPPIMRVALRVMGWRDIGRWIADWLRFSRTALACALVGGWLPAVVRLIEQGDPARAFRWRAHLAEWQAMGWLRDSSLPAGSEG